MTGVGQQPNTLPDFDSLYRRDADPWQVQTSWYERRKLAVVLAGLPRERYSSAWEPGCGPGFTTAALATRVDRLVASDGSAVAATAASESLSSTSHVEVVCSSLPEIPLSQPVDLVVAAEFVYYIDDWAGSVAALWSALEPGGHLAVVHWTHHPHDAFRSGREQHALIGLDAAERGAQLLVNHAEADFIFEVYEATS